MRKLKKYVEYIYTKIVRYISEKKYFSRNGITLKYIIKKSSNSKTLIVVLSACTRKGIPARYNYMKTLNSINANKLFILDDFGFDRRGAYYLGKNGNNEIECACNNLISKYIKLLSIDNIIFVGSSKGGWAALNLMTNFKNSSCIIGAPQYLLGNYITEPALINCQKYIMPNITKKNIEYLNNYLSKKLQKAKNDGHKVYLHYSNKEHTFKEHVKYLIEDLKKYNYESTEDCAKYKEHNEVSSYFPQFLLTSLKKYYNLKERSK